MEQKMSKQATCAERIADQLASREEYVASLLAKCQGNEASDEADNAQQELDELSLSVEHEILTTITLSYGGPADYLEVLHSENHITKITYRFSDWFDTASKDVEIGSPLWDYASSIVENMEGAY
jgi:hypothetical protein